MPETPKKRPEVEEKEYKKPDDSTWSEDQKRREYYYDDAHGYEVYTPDEDEKDSD
jgi:hypothetical protein